MENNVRVKRRRLSNKQVEKLKQSVIAPIKEPKWEYFYSLNYQADVGEGIYAKFNKLATTFLFAYLGKVVELNWESDSNADEDEDGHDNNEVLDEADNCEENRNDSPETTTRLDTLDSGIETLGGKKLHLCRAFCHSPKTEFYKIRKEVFCSYFGMGFLWSYSANIK